ncbi:class I SAM-dependent methyltransferase [Amycolatopsis eburnea]|uniref:class I SAM-dependent methyltransferase n=1 Tax=Amycolatopsis eburnea TaxID=2267691 RepID=UPI00298A011D|nr:class I SAM-dependent methyltransferase [Amycolatopsis eburnea]
MGGSRSRSRGGRRCAARGVGDREEDAGPVGEHAVLQALPRRPAARGRGLGAEFDTRPCRLPQLRGVPVFEVDLPANSARKEAALRKRFGRVPDGVTLVPVDWEAQDFRTFVVWEAVTQYLTEPAVRRTLAQLGDLAPGSRLAFTHVRKDFLDGKEFYGVRSAYDDFVVKWRLRRFGLEPGEVAGLTNVDSAYIARYLDVSTAYIGKGF